MSLIFGQRIWSALAAQPKLPRSDLPGPEVSSYRIQEPGNRTAQESWQQESNCRTAKASKVHVILTWHGPQFLRPWRLGQGRDYVGRQALHDGAGNISVALPSEAASF